MPEEEQNTESTWAAEFVEMIRQVVREEIALHMERSVRYRGWGPAKDTMPRFLRKGESMPTREEP